MSKMFTKNDNGFVCENCGKEVTPLGYTSRNHCPHCLCSLHVDVNPGDRENTCRGLQRPIGVEQSNKKGYVIIYKCSRCGKITRNKSANDDSFEQILKVSSHSMNNDFDF